MKTYFLTDQGQVRSINEDTGGVFYNDQGQVLAIVADGLGGHNAGEIASSLAVQSAESKWQQTDKIADTEEAASWLKDVISEANTAIFNHSKEDPSFEGMGTTMVLAVCDKDFLTVAHVGDSRGYLIDNQQVEQITKDHSLVNELLKNGQISPEDAEAHPRKNVLSRAVGTEEKVQSEVNTFYWKEADVLLLCSDGLTDKLNFQDLQSFFTNYVDEESLSKELVHTANERGGEDNITLLMVRHEPTDESGDATC